MVRGHSGEPVGNLDIAGNQSGTWTLRDTSRESGHYGTPVGNLAVSDLDQFGPDPGGKIHISASENTFPE